MTMHKPNALQKGDRVAVLAPASSFDEAVFDVGVAELRGLGFDPVYDKSVFARKDYVAGIAEQRAASLRDAWLDPGIAAIFVARGGYGSAQLLPLLDVGEFRSSCKPFVGCSDLTALLIYLTGCCNLVCFHGPMLVNFAKKEAGYDKASLLGCLSNQDPLGELRPTGLDVVKHGEARGVLLGGTLTQLLASLSTPFAFNPPSGYVLFLDDIGERPYRIDRMITQAKQAGILSSASAVVCSEFPDCNDSEDLNARSVIVEQLADFDGPIIFGFPSGHTTGQMLTLPFGVVVTVSTRPYPKIVIEEASVK